ncbi:MAG: fasciclin domain-containing protein [Proteobacteria bacterium]|nr:fasciclin domain-containing protein [Burkholderiales bacterium]
MKSLRSIALNLSAAMTLGIAAATASAADMANMDIVDTAAKNGSFKTLVSLIKQAGLVDTLKGKGPFTVFAPTDEAFAKVPKATLDGLAKDKEKLAAVLTYHVVPGRVLAKDVKAGGVKTVNGQDVRLDTAGGVTVNGAKVISADVMASNGVIHVIDSVILPK